jgi:hypothetical protein
VVLCQPITYGKGKFPAVELNRHKTNGFIFNIECGNHHFFGVTVYKENPKIKFQFF